MAQSSSNESKKDFKSFDDFLLELGDPGTYRTLVFAGLVGSVFPVFLITINYLFVAYVPPYRCKLPANSSWRNDFVPNNPSQDMFNECHMWMLDEETSVPIFSNCFDGYEFDLHSHEWFVSNEYELVCENRFFLNLGLSLLYAGVMVGNLIFGPLADRIGRRKCLIFAAAIETILGIILLFANSAIFYFTCAFLAAVCTQGFQIAAYAASSELFHPRRRTLQGIIINSPWPVSFVLLSLFYMFLGNWRIVQIITICVTAVITVYSWFLPESIRWLMVKGRIDEAVDIAKKFLHFNGLPVRETLKEDMTVLANEMVPKSNPSRGFFSTLMRSAMMRKHSFILSVACFSAMMLFLGVAFSIPDLSPNLYISYIVAGSLEILANILSFFIFQWFGRKRPLMGCFIFGGLSSILGAFIRYWSLAGSASETLSVVFAIAALLSMTITMVGLILCMTEVYPTSMRSAGISLCSTLGRIGSMVSPPVMLLNEVWFPLPMLICGGIAFIASILLLQLPETNRQPLPDTIYDVKRLRRESGLED